MLPSKFFKNYFKQDITIIFGVPILLKVVIVYIYLICMELYVHMRLFMKTINTRNQV